ncbi:SDR family NAD(P)-dependent oxidoreductase [Spirosoma jeollabukense]
MANQQEQSTQERLIALVTGANQGIGLEIAKALSANGYIVLVGSRNFTKGQVAAQSIGSTTYPIQLDVTDETSIREAAKRVGEEFGKLDLLVNNAAIAHAGRPGQTVAENTRSSLASVASLDEMRAVWETNVFGVLAVTQSMLPFLRKSAAGRIVNVSSGVGSLTLNADPSFPYRRYFGAIYPASKTALNAITLALALELEGENIKVNAASPGFTATALNNFEGTDSIEIGARNPIRVALELDGPTGTFTGPDGELPW